jgi:hypothetical protein
LYQPTARRGLPATLYGLALSHPALAARAMLERNERRPAAAAARRLFPTYPEPVPPVLPPEWVKPLFR